MTLSFLPYGRLPSGQYGISEGTGLLPIAASIEILGTIPSPTDPNNFPGRSVFDIANSTLYQYIGTTPTGTWKAVDEIPVAVGNTNPTTPNPSIPGQIYYQTSTKLLYVWDGAQWDIIGGQYAASLLVNDYVGDGTTTAFATGSSSLINAISIFATIDGVLQSPINDYTISGSSVLFSTPPAANTLVELRSLVSAPVIQNSQINRASFTGNGAQTIYSAPDSNLNINSTFVFVNKVLQIPYVDYTLSPANNSILTITNISGITTVVTQVPHNIPIGSAIMLEGITGGASGAVAAYNNQSFVVTTVPTPTSFTFTLSGGPTTASGTSMYYSPTFTNDTVTFTTAPFSGYEIEIRTLKNAVVAPTSNLITGFTSVGSGISICYNNSGNILQFKSLVAGENITLIDQGTDVVINVNTLNSFENAVYFNGNYYAVVDTTGSFISYLGVKNTGNVPVNINLTGIPLLQAGRRITIVDESGTASINNITISTGGPLINNSGNTFVINTNYGYVTLVQDGANYFISNVS